MISRSNNDKGSTVDLPTPGGALITTLVEGIALAIGSTREYAGRWERLVFIVKLSIVISFYA
ncbi:hypothetical protein KUL49_04830 [Alteromonas sp. KUL49]|nr:hypothetical protein KUL49_04830 [Alteromonas sp. KUL49]